MYSADLTVSGLQMTDADYRGTEQYARAKRAQVVLNEMWAERFGTLGIHFHAMHPGWASTPGVDASLPTFSKVMGPLLRSPEQGADTLVWLAADDDPAAIQRPLLARPSTAQHPQAPSHEERRHARSPSTALGLGLRDQRQRAFHGRRSRDNRVVGASPAGP